DAKKTPRQPSEPLDPSLVYQIDEQKATTDLAFPEGTVANPPSPIILSQPCEARFELRRKKPSQRRTFPFSRLSRIRVTGPSLVKETCIIAPNTPVSTVTPWLRSSSLNRSYSPDAISGAAAAVKLGRRPFRQSPYRVNWDTDKMLPPTSRRD